jgi:hypothetical protein
MQVVPEQSSGLPLHPAQSIRRRQDPISARMEMREGRAAQRVAPPADGSSVSASTPVGRRAGSIPSSGLAVTPERSRRSSVVRAVAIEVDDHSSAHPLSYRDAATHAWAIAPGDHAVHVGNSRAARSIAPG